MDTRRVILYAALAVIVYSLWNSWLQDHPVVNNSNKSPERVIVKTDNGLLPELPANKLTTQGVIKENKDVDAGQNKKQSIEVKTDVLQLTIDPAQGDVIETQLLHYPISLAEPKPITLLYEKLGQRYVANSSLFTNENNLTKNITVNYTSSSNYYQMDDNAQELIIVLQGKTADGLAVKKLFVFTRGSYLINVAYEITNDSNTAWQGYMNTQLLRQAPEEDNSNMFHVGSYTGASYSNPGQHRYKKFSFKEMNKTNLNVETHGGWIAMQQHYFLSAWIPAANSTNLLYSRNNYDQYIIGAVSPMIIVPPGVTTSINSQLYVGPENADTLKNIAPGLDQTIDYGWLWMLSSLLFSLMKILHTYLGNWGWSIVMVTVLIKLAFYYFSAKSYKSMAAMRRLQPKIQAIRERYSDDKARMSQAIIELYKQEKVHPLGGCLPILIQIPFFIALYWVLLESVELRQAPFILWIKDLSAMDPYHILPIIMGGTMLIQQRLNPAPPDPMQAKVMMFLPVLFTALFWNFPAGLVLYWIVNNSLSILQQWYITQKYADKPVSYKNK